MDVLYEINAIERRVGRRTLAAGEARVATITRAYQAEVADVWDACTSPERIRRWFLPVSGDLRAGGQYQLEGNAGGTVERCDPPRSFAATWEYGGEVSWITLRLTADGPSRTRLELEHVAHVADTRWLEYGPGATGVGWDLTFLGLGLYLATGETVGDPDAWAVSAEGREFATASSDRWCAASIADGTDSSQARQAADRTTAFYTGVAQ